MLKSFAMLLFPRRGHFTAENNIMYLLLFITKSGLTNSTTHNFCDYCLTYQSHYSRSEKFLLLIVACRNGHLFELKKNKYDIFPHFRHWHRHTHAQRNAAILWYTVNAMCTEKCSNTVVYSKCCVQRKIQQYCGVQ